MSKRTDAFDIRLDLVVSSEPNENKLETKTRKVMVSRFRKRTISDYNLQITEYHQTVM